MGLYLKYIYVPNPKVYKHYCWQYHSSISWYTVWDVWSRIVNLRDKTPTAVETDYEINLTILWTVISCFSLKDISNCSHKTFTLQPSFHLIKKNHNAHAPKGHYTIPHFTNKAMSSKHIWIQHSKLSQTDIHVNGMGIHGQSLTSVLLSLGPTSVSTYTLKWNAPWIRGCEIS